MTTQAVSAFTTALDKAGVPYELVEHRRTETAAAEAAALGVPPHDVAKTLVVSTPAGHLRAVLPASERLDLHKLRDLLEAGKDDVRLLTEEELARSYPEFELGAVPPIGGRGDRVLIDRRLASHASVVLEAGDHEWSARLATSDLLALAGGETADLCAD